LVLTGGRRIVITRYVNDYVEAMCKWGGFIAGYLTSFRTSWDKAMDLAEDPRWEDYVVEWECEDAPPEFKCE